MNPGRATLVRGGGVLSTDSDPMMTKKYCRKNYTSTASRGAQIVRADTAPCWVSPMNHDERCSEGFISVL